MSKPFETVFITLRPPRDGDPGVVEEGRFRTTEGDVVVLVDINGKPRLDKKGKRIQQKLKPGENARVWGHNYRETGLCSGVTGSSMSRQGAGVLGRGQGSESAGVMGVNGEGGGVIGHSVRGVGAMGVSDDFHGVVGTASNNARCGVFGINASGFGVGGKSIDGIGVSGGSNHNQGVFGITTDKIPLSTVASFCAHTTEVLGETARRSCSTA